MKPTARIAELGEKCFGCGACAASCPSSCIEMQEDEKGFIHPVIDAERCLHCHLCDRTCPAINLRKQDEVVSCCGAVAQDRKELARSSSGGVFGMLARNVLEQGGVVVGAAFDNDLTVRHILIDSIGDLPRLQSSKYVQSSIDSWIYVAIRQALDEHRRVLFSGTACQIAGLRGFLGILADVPELLLAEVVCHGVPSPKLWRLWKAYQEDTCHEKLVDVRFRDKSTGWSSYSVVYVYGNGRTKRRLAANDWYMKSFLCNDSLRPSCFSCKAKCCCGSDITLCDFWGIWSLKPMAKWSDGTSAVVVHTERGSKAIKEVGSSLSCFVVAYNDIKRGNPSLEFSANAGENRDEFMSLLASSEADIEELLVRFPYRRSIVQRATSVAGVIRSIINHATGLNSF